MRSRFAAALGIAALLTASCGGVVSPSNNVTETFSGTLEPFPSANSIVIFGFTTTKSGEISVKITALAPATNVFLQTFYGQTQSDGSCGILQANQFSTLNTTSLAGGLTPGRWCVGIRDLGTLLANETFTLSVGHP